MPAKKNSESEDSLPRQMPARDSYEREMQMVALADALAERQLREGTASSQVITHYLKLGTTMHQLEKEKAHSENLRLQAQVEQIKSQQRTEELMAEVLLKMKEYAGVDDD